MELLLTNGELNLCPFQSRIATLVCRGKLSQESKNILEGYGISFGLLVNIEKVKDIIEQDNILKKSFQKKFGEITVEKAINIMGKNDYSFDQLIAIRKIFEFLFSNDNRFCLYGYAGTGKTTVIVQLCCFLIENNYYKKICFAAPTNQAVNIIKNKVMPHLVSIVSKITKTKNIDFN